MHAFIGVRNLAGSSFAAAEKTMFVVSFDIGMRNFAGTAVTVARDADGQVRVKEMHGYFCEDILEAGGCTARVSRSVQTDRLVGFTAESLRRNFGDLSFTPDVVVVESQRGKKECMISAAVLGFYASEAPSAKLRMMNALSKFKVAKGAKAPPTQGSKAQRHEQLKQAAIELAETLYPGMCCELGVKAEHCADALCQAVAAGHECLPKIRAKRKRAKD